MKKEFSVTEKLHIFNMPAAWIYIPIPKDKVPNIKPGGWGSIPLVVTIGKTTWRTSMFPIKKDNYFIPVKKKVRDAEDIFVDDKVTVKYKLA